MNLILGLGDTLEILALRWKMLRKPVIKISLLVTLVISMVLLWGLSGLSSVIKYGAQLNSSDPALTSVHNIAVAYLNLFLNSGGVIAATTVLLSLFGSLFLIPLLGYTNSGFIPASDMVSVRKNDRHLLGDSLALQFVSFLAVAQISIILLLNSLIALTSNAPGVAVLIGWGVWILFTMAANLVTWTFEYFHRRYGPLSKYFIPLVAFAALGLLALLFPNDAVNLFGISSAYLDLVRNSGDYNVGQLILIALAFLAATAALGGGISFVGSRALNLPERARKKRAFHINLLGFKKAHISTFTFMLNNVLRQSNIRKPLLTATIFSLGSTILFGGNLQVLQSLIFVVPLIVTLTWGANTFGILGSGVTWLLSLPNGQRNMLRHIVAVQFALIGVIHVLILLPMLLIFHVDLGTVASFTLSTLFVSLIITRSGIYKTVMSPERYRVYIRGESALPPLKALWYLIRFGLSAGIPGLILFYLPLETGPKLLVQLFMVLLIFGWEVLRFARLERAWRKGYYYGLFPLLETVRQRSFRHEPNYIRNIIVKVGTN
jgi:hypothetical protein